MNGDEKAVLIVDDEYYAVQGIAQNVKWERLGVGKTYTAYSREQAERILREHSVDILLTDIEMPRISRFCASNREERRPKCTANSVSIRAK